MSRWMSKRWAWAAVVGLAMFGGAVRGTEPPQKVGAVISLNIDGKGDRQFKVLKCEKQPDGSYHSELKDTKTGETITLVDQPDANPAPNKGTETPKNAPNTAPQAKPRANDPLTPPVAAAMPDPNKDKDKEKRPLLGRVFGDRDKAPAPAMTPAPATEPAKKPGLFARVFGPKKPTGPSMPAAAQSPAQNTPATPPPVLPTPPGGLTGGA
ncbi:MAG: hypothetical protein K2V38_21550, partial [Gemmataceae bacterium]|nr:hypothetical protein [Gemmataceae bacterium]